MDIRDQPTQREDERRERKLEIVILLLYYEKHKGHEADRKTFALGDKDDRKMAEARVAGGREEQECRERSDGGERERRGG